MRNTKEKDVLIMADLHFGIKRFNLAVLDDQINLFTKQIFPYMKKNNIDTIYQLGDFFDNRTTVDIGWLDKIKSDFFDVLKENGFMIKTLKGNHDIFHRESREVALVDTFEELYPDNFHVFGNREKITLLGQEIYIVPWITKGETLIQEEIENVDYIFGHFETKGFYVVPGICDTTSFLNTEFFAKNPRIKGVFSGHYHLKDTNGLVKYLGSAYALNWSDHNDMKGFYHFDGFSLDYIENVTSKKYIKIKYNDEQNTDKNIEVKGFYEHSIMLTDKEFEDLLPVLKKHELKTFINKHKDDSYEEMLYKMKKADIKTSVVNNQELSELIGTDVQDNINISDTRSLIIDTLSKQKPELLPLLNELLAEVQTETMEV